MSRIVAVFGIFLLAFMAVYGVSAVYEESGDDYEYPDESFTPDPGNVTELQHSNLDDVLYYESVTVNGENEAEMEPGRDYEWHSSNGTIKTLEDGRLADDTSATITYGYNRPTDGQQTVAALAAMLLGNIEVLGFAFVLGLFLVYIVNGGA